MFFERYFKGRSDYKRFVQELRQRTEKGWMASWGERVLSIGEICSVIESEMNLPNCFLMPEDPLRLVFFNLSQDMREISALERVSGICSVSLDDYSNMTMADLIPRRGLPNTD
jgi:hypothetical protein